MYKYTNNNKDKSKKPAVAIVTQGGGEQKCSVNKSLINIYYWLQMKQ